MTHKYYLATDSVNSVSKNINLAHSGGNECKEDKIGVCIDIKDEYTYEWFIKPSYRKISIESLATRTIFICESCEEKSISIISEDKEVLFKNLDGVQRIEGTDSFVINTGETNSLIHFLEDGQLLINSTKFYRIYKLSDKLINEFISILSEDIEYIGIKKQKSELSFDNNHSQNFLLDKNFKIKHNIKYVNAICPIQQIKKCVILTFNHIQRGLEFKLLFTVGLGIVNNFLAIDINYLGKGNLYKIMTLDNKWNVIDSYGSEYLTRVDDIGNFESDDAENIIFCKNGKYGALNRSGEVLNIPLGGALRLHENSYGAKSGYIIRGCSIMDILGNSYEVSFLTNGVDTESKIKPVIDDNCFSTPIGGGLYCLRSTVDSVEESSYVVNRLGILIKDKREGQYLQFLNGLFVFRTKDSIYQVIDENDVIIFSSERKIKILDVPNYPIIAVKGERLSIYAQRIFWELYNLKGERILQDIEQIHNVKTFCNGNLLVGSMKEIFYTYPTTETIHDYDGEDKTTYEYSTLDIKTKDVMLWGLYSVRGKEILPQVYSQIEKDTNFNLIKLTKICGESGKGFYQLYGYADYIGNILLEPSYEEIEVFTDSFLKVKLNGRYGLIDHAFKRITPCRYLTLEILEENNLSIYARKPKFPFFKTEKGILSPSGSLIVETEKARMLLPRRISHLSDFINGIAVIYNDTMGTLRCGMINHFGEYIIEDKYLKIELITDNIYKCRNNYDAMYEFDLYIIKKGHKASLVGSFDFVGTPSDKSIGVGKKLDKNKPNITYGIIDFDGNYILEMCSSTLGKEIDDYRTVTVANRVGFVNIVTKRLVLIPDANYIGPLHNGIAAFAIGSQKNRDGKIRGGKWGAINQYGEIVVAPNYHYIFTDKQGRIYFRNHISKIGMIDKEEHVIISDEYDLWHNDTDATHIVLIKKMGFRKGKLYKFNNDGILLDIEEYEEEIW